MSDMSITVVEKIYNDNPLFLREREAVNINLLRTRESTNIPDANCNPFLKNFFLVLLIPILTHSAVFVLTVT